MSRLPTTNGNGAAAETPTREIAQTKRDEIAAALKSRVAVLASLLGGVAFADRFCRTALAHWSTTANMSPKDRARLEGVDATSYANACQAAALERLAPDGRDGWIVVRNDGTATWTISWRGMVRRFRRAVKRDGGHVKKFCAEIVYQEEIDAGGFDVDLANDTITHRPWYMLGIEIEPMWDSVVLAYACVTIVPAKGPEYRQFRVITIAELRQRAAMSGDPRNPSEVSEAWDRWPRSQSKKSAVRSLMDWLATPDDLDAFDGRTLPEADAPRSVHASPHAALAARVRAVGETEATTVVAAARVDVAPAQDDGGVP